MKRKKRSRSPLVIVFCLVVIAVVGAVAYFEKSAERQAIEISQLRQRLMKLESGAERSPAAATVPQTPPPGIILPRSAAFSPNNLFRVRLAEPDAAGEVRLLQILSANGDEVLQEVAQLSKTSSYTRQLRNNEPVGDISWDKERGIVASIYSTDRKPYPCVPGDCVKRVAVREFEIFPEGIEWR